jgi:Dolichyl-phosphate-mannose-protein mannosyltransferase
MFTEFKYFKNVKKLDLVISSVLTLLVLITRIPFMSKFLYEWDAVNYALGFEKYDMLHHQPHPPGYILYVGLGRWINTLLNDPNTTMIFISIVFSILTVLLAYFLAKQMFSRTVAIVGSLLLVFNPLFWFYGEIATIYPSEAFFATLMAYLSYQVLRGNEKFLYLSALVLGLAGGFRQDLIVFLFPLWLFCIFYRDRNYNRLIKALLVLIPSIMFWFIPTIILAGGWENYAYMGGVLIKLCFTRTSVIFGVGILNKLSAIGAFVCWLGLAMSFVGVFILILFHRYHDKGMFHLLKIHKRDPRAIFFVLWGIPASIFYLLVHLAKPGYMLVLLPALMILMGYALKILSSDLEEKYKNRSAFYFISIILVFSILFNTAYFVFPYDLNEESLWQNPLPEMDALHSVLWIGDVGFLYNSQKIRTNDNDTRIYMDAVLNIPNSDPNNTIIVMGDISRVNEGFSWRKAMYYLPNYHIYYLVEAETNPIFPLQGYHHTYNWSEARLVEIPLEPSTEKVVWMISDKSIFYKQLESQADFKTIDLPRGLKIYYSDLKNQRPVTGKFIFRTEK